MKTASQILTDWGIPAGSAIACTYDQMTPVIRAAMAAGITNAREQLQHDVLKGVDCVVCGQFAKRYRRALNANMVSVLILLYRYTKDHVPPDGWVHLPSVDGSYGISTSSREYSKARFWGLIEERPNDDDPSKKDSGFWRILAAGVKFVESHLQVMSHALTYDNELLGHDGKLVTVSDCLGKKFHYANLMEGNA